LKIFVGDGLFHKRFCLFPLHGMPFNYCLAFKILISSSFWI
jgi:hypothetical protein